MTSDNCPETGELNNMANGKITQVIGTVVDVEFPPEDMPSIFNALETYDHGGKADGLIGKGDTKDFLRDNPTV